MCQPRMCNTHVLMLINHVTSNMLSFPFSNGKMGRVDKEIVRVKRFGIRKTRPYTKQKPAGTKKVSLIRELSVGSSPVPHTFQMDAL
jgi:hypothetical protein